MLELAGGHVQNDTINNKYNFQRFDMDCKKMPAKSKD